MSTPQQPPLNYTVVVDRSPDQLSATVSQLRNQGWQLYGDLQIERFPDETGDIMVYAQVLTK